MLKYYVIQGTFKEGNLLEGNFKSKNEANAYIKKDIAFGKEKGFPRRKYKDYKITKMSNQEFNKLRDIENGWI